MGRSRSRTFSRSRSRSVVSGRNGISLSVSRSRSRSRRSRSISRDKERRRVRSASRDRKKRRDYSRSRSRSPYRGNRNRHGGGRPSSKYSVPRDNPDPNRCLGVFNLSLYTTEQDLRRIFDEFGDLEKIDLIYDHPSGRSRGFAFITYKCLDDAVTAREKMIGTDIDGHRIRIDFSLTKRAHSPTPGQYMGAFRGRGRGGRRGYRSERGYGGSNRSPSPRYSRGSPRRRSRSRSPYGRRSRSRSPRY